MSRAPRPPRPPGGVVDLARERRIRETINRLAAHLAARADDPTLAARDAAALAPATPTDAEVAAEVAAVRAGLAPGADAAALTAALAALDAAELRSDDAAERAALDATRSLLRRRLAHAAPTQEPPAMPDDTRPPASTTFRLTDDAVTRADALLPHMAADRRLAAIGTVSRSAVLRLALEIGLSQLERETHRRAREARNLAAARAELAAARERSEQGNAEWAALAAQAEESRRRLVELAARYSPGDGGAAFLAELAALAAPRTAPAAPLEVAPPAASARRKGRVPRRELDLDPLSAAEAAAVESARRSIVPPRRELDLDPPRRASMPDASSAVLPDDGIGLPLEDDEEP